MTHSQIEEQFKGIEGINKFKNEKSMEDIKSKYGCKTVRTKEKGKITY